MDEVSLFTEDDLHKKALKHQEAQWREIAEMKLKLKKLRTEKEKQLKVTIKAINIGQIIEHFTPILRGFEYHPNDCRALLKPIDYLVFNGYHKNKVDSIRFVEIKSGKAGITGREKQVRDIIESGKVQFHVIGEKP